jgi:hypothetical protein
MSDLFEFFFSERWLVDRDDAMRKTFLLQGQPTNHTKFDLDA